MTVSRTKTAGPRPGGPPRRPTVWDAALAIACLALAVGVLLSGDQAVAANREPDALGVVLTSLAVGVLVLRRRYPTVVLVVSLSAVLALMAVGSAVGVTTLGPFVALYTAVALGSRRDARLAVGLVLAAVASTMLLDPVDLTREGVLFLLAGLVLVLLVAEGVRARRTAHAAEVQEANRATEAGREQARAQLERATLAAAQERLRITRDLHDVIGHALSVMVVQAGVAERLLSTRPEQARESIEEIARTGRGSLAEMRAILGTLRNGDPDGDGLDDAHDGPDDDGWFRWAPSGEEPTLADVPALAARVQHAGLPVVVTVIGHGYNQAGAAAPGVELAAYRVVQEALTNCLRHSGARRASVTLTHGPDGVEVDVVDDGDTEGPDVGAATSLPDGGHGIAGMRERVAIYGGRLSVGPAPGRGFRVQAWFPTTAAAASRP